MNFKFIISLLAIISFNSYAETQYGQLYETRSERKIVSITIKEPKFKNQIMQELGKTITSNVCIKDDAIEFIMKGMKKQCPDATLDIENSRQYPYHITTKCEGQDSFANLKKLENGSYEGGFAGIYSNPIYNVRVSGKLLFKNTKIPCPLNLVDHK